MIALMDLDGTLVDRDAGFAVWVATFAADFGLGAEGMTWLYTWDRQARERGRFFAGVVEHFELGPVAEELWSSYRAFMPEATPVYAGVATGLAALREGGWRLVVLTNGGRENQLGKLRRHGLLDLVDAACVSQDTGLRKPDPRAFEMAISVLEVGICPSRVWVLGDDPVLDIDAGARAGLSAIWISHGRRWPQEPAGLTPPTCITVTPADGLGHLRRLGQALSPSPLGKT